MGLLGMTEHLKSNYASLFEQIHFSSANPVILLVDQAAFAEHICGLLTKRATRDGSSAHAFSFTCAYLSTLVANGVKSLYFVSEGLLPLAESNSPAVVSFNEEGATRAAEYVLAPAGEEIGQNHRSLPGNASGIEDALAWLSATNPSVSVVKLRSDGDAGFLTASTAAKLQVEHPKKKVLILSNDSSYFFMHPSPRLVFLDDFEVDAKANKVKARSLATSSLSKSKTFDFEDTALMPVLAVLLGESDPASARAHARMHDKLIRGMGPRPHNVDNGTLAEKNPYGNWCKNGLLLHNKREEIAYPFGEYCTNHKCALKHLPQRSKNFAKYPFFLTIEGKRDPESGDLDDMKNFFERCLNEANMPAQGILRADRADPWEIPGATNTFTMALNAAKWNFATGSNKPRQLKVLFEHLPQLLAVNDFIETDEVETTRSGGQPKWLKTAKVSFPHDALLRLKILRTAKMIRDTSSVTVESEGNKFSFDSKTAEFVAKAHFGGSATMAKKLLEGYQRYTGLGSEGGSSQSTPGGALSKNYADLPLKLLRFGTENKIDRFVDVSNAKGVPATALCKSIDSIVYALILGTSHQVTQKWTRTENTKSGPAARTVDERMGGSPSLLTPPAATEDATDADKELLGLLGGGAEEWNKLDYKHRITKLQVSTVSTRTALLMNLLGVVSEGDELDTWILGADGAPKSLLFLIAALRFWVLEAAKKGDNVSDIEIHAAVGGLVCALEPAFASSTHHCDPIKRLEFEHQADVERLQREVDGVEHPEAATAKTKRVAFKDKNTVVKVTIEGDEDEGKLAVITGSIDELEDTLYNVRAHTAGTKIKAAFKGADLEIVHLKPVWLTAEGLRRLDQWQSVLEKVQDLSDALQLPSAYLSTVAVDPVDFLFSHWLGQQVAGPDIDQKVRTSTTTIVAWLQARRTKADRKDPVRENIKRRCDVLKTNSSESLMKLFDALLSAVKSKAVAAAANPALQCDDRDISALAAPKDDDDDDDDAAWDDSSDDEEEGAGPYTELGSTLSAVLQVAVASSTEADEKVAAASFRMLARLPRSELRALLEASGAADAADPSPQLSALLKFKDPQVDTGETIFDPFAFKSAEAVAAAYESDTLLGTEDERISHIEE
jgi:hypothetical protein